MNRALFLDRDGVINEDYGYVHKIEDFHFREGIFDVCRAAQQARMKIIVVTNQAGIGRGYYSVDDFQYITDYMVERFRLEHIHIDNVYKCPFHPEHGLGHYKLNSYDRKPRPGMFIKACQQYNINPGLSVMIGDKPSDRDAAYSVGIKHYIDSNMFSWVCSATSAIKMA